MGFVLVPGARTLTAVNPLRSAGFRIGAVISRTVRNQPIAHLSQVTVVSRTINQ